MNKELRNAVARGEIADVIQLLEQKPNLDIHAKDWWEGYSLIHLAARHGHVAMAELLLKLGAKANEAAGGGHTPLHFTTFDYDYGNRVSSSSSRTTVQVLVEEGGPNIVHQKAWTSGNTALHLASENGFIMTACDLLNHGADLQAINNRGLTPLDMTSNEMVKTILNYCDSWHFKSKKHEIAMQLHIQKHDQDFLMMELLNNQIQKERKEVATLGRMLIKEKEGVLKLREQLDMANHCISVLLLTTVTLFIALVVTCCLRKPAPNAAKKKSKETATARSF